MGTKSGTIVEPAVGQCGQCQQVGQTTHHHDQDGVGEEGRSVLLDAVQEAVILVAGVGGGARQRQSLAFCSSCGGGGGVSSVDDLGVGDGGEGCGG